MARKKKPPVPQSAPPPPQIFEASLGTNGSVVKGQPITQAQAEARRRMGLDVVVCGPNLSANRSLAGTIETGANGKARRCPPHASAGSNALPHYQPDPQGERI